MRQCLIFKETMKSPQIEYKKAMNRQSVILQAGGRPQIPSFPKACKNFLILRLSLEDQVFQQDCQEQRGTWRVITCFIIKHQHKPRDFLPTLSMHPQQEMPFLKSPVPVISCATGILTLISSEVPGEGGRI